MRGMQEHRNTLLLIDGSSYLYRAFFAGGDDHERDPA